jgi:hypothetical protein
MPLTDVTQAQYRREGLRYASDFTDAESKFAKPIMLLPHQSNARETNLRAPDFYRAEQVGVLIALILRLTRARALLRPLVGETVLLSDPHFILEPNLNRSFRCEPAHNLGDARGKIFF